MTSTLICETALLKVSANSLSKYNGNSLICSLFLELTIAGNLTEAYEKTWASIYWRNANYATKKRVEQTLNELAFKIADHLETSITLFNQICDHNNLIKNTDSELYFVLSKINYSLSEVYATIKNIAPYQQLKLLP